MKAFTTTLAVAAAVTLLAGDGATQATADCHSHGGGYVQPAYPGISHVTINLTVTYGPWQFHELRNYYYRVCYFPGGGIQYLIYYPEYRPNWVYWFNPAKGVFWCACPTITHPQWGATIDGGQPLFLLASVKAATVDACQFTHPGLGGENFQTSATAPNASGTQVNLGTPPEDLP